MLFPCMECDPFLQQAVETHPQSSPCVRICLHDKWPFYCLYTLTHTLMQEKEGCCLGDFFWLHTKNHPHNLNTIFTLPINHFQPTVVKQVFRSENFGLMLGFKTFQTKWAAEFSWTWRTGGLPCPRRMTAHHCSSPRGCIPGGSHWLVCDVHVKVTLPGCLSLQTGLKHYVHTESSI